MKAYQCSVCENLYDLNENCACCIGIDPRPSHREKEDLELCRQNFKRLPQDKVWHEEFYWERL